MFAFILFAFLLNFSAVFALKFECEGFINLTGHDFPVNKEKVSLGSNYEIILRSTNWLKGNETAKFVEQNFDGSLVVRKWTRKMESAWFNRSVIVEDHFRMPDAHHLEHNRSCQAQPSATTNYSLNPFGLSPEFLQALGMSEANFGKLLDKIAGFPKYNGSLYDVEPVMGVEVVGWLGCVQNVSGGGKNLQLNVRFAGDHTAQEPYNPYWTNPLVYTLDLVYYEVHNGTAPTVFDHLSIDVVAQDRVHLAEKEFATTPPSGVYCQGMPPISLPVQFPHQFLAQISITRMEADKPRTSQNMYFYDGQQRIVAYSPEIFQQQFEKMDDKKWPTIRHIIHDFNYGFQYAISPNGTCLSIAPIDPNSPDVTTLPEPENSQNEREGPGQLLFMLHPEETLIWHGRRQRMAQKAFYYAGKVKSSETAEPLAVFSTTRPSSRQEWSERNAPSNETQELVEIRLSLGKNQQPNKFHSILAFNGTNRGEGDRMETQQIFMEGENEAKMNGEGQAWRTLHSLIRSCIKLEEEQGIDGEEGNKGGNGTGKGGNGSDFYVQLANVTLSQLDQTIGRGEAMGAVAQALALASNISQLRIVDLELKEVAKEANGEKGKTRILVALFSIGRPVEGVKPAKTAYLKEEINVEQAATTLNETVRAHRFQIRIPLEQPKKDWNITGSAFGTQSSLFPSPWPPAPIPPPPSPPTPSFVGYSGSALAICSIFAFVLGSGLVIGSYYFYQKRQHIRGFAYQVFE